MDTPRARGLQPFSVVHRGLDGDAARATFHRPYAEVLAGCARVLDVGCGDGAFLDLVRAQGATRALGIERDPAIAADARARGHDVLMGDARIVLPTLGERFDGIYASFVIETMDGDEGLAFLRACVSLLAPGGVLVLRSLNPRNAQVREGGFWFEPWNVRPWPLETLHVALGDLGLRIVGAGAEPEGWQHTYLVGRAPAIAATTRVPVAWQGEFFAFNSMALVNRELVRALARLRDVAPLIVPDEPQREASVANDPRFAALHERVRRDMPAANVLVRQSNGRADFRRGAERALVQILPWEYGAIPLAWSQGLAEGGADEVWVPSAFNRWMFLDAGIAPERVVVVPNGIDPAIYAPDPAVPRMPLPSEKSFRFLFSGGALMRKGIDVLLAAYRRAFTRSDDVTLVLKLFGARSFYPIADGGESFRAFAEDPSAPELVILEDDLPEERIVHLYRSCDALAFPYRGEGFGLPMLEALACGLPVIATHGGAADEFLGNDAEYVRSRRVTLPEGFHGETLTSDGWWLKPDTDALAETMRRVVADPAAARAKALRGSARVRREWTWERAAEIAAARLRALGA